MIPELTCRLNNPNFPNLSRVLLRWFTQNARDLPWRNTFDPYAIWVSEIMLQQTQVKTVIPYWERWISSFPTIEAVARASEPEILKAWEGLGYYSRPRNLQRAARKILFEHGGVFPRDYAAVLELPGIGRYTAGAICSIAFNQPTAILDGNVARVLARVFMIGGDVKSNSVREKLWELSGKIIESALPLNQNGVHACSSVNQGLMELGALVCRPKTPKCALCPLVSDCDTFKNNKIEDFPKSVSKKFQRPLHFAVILRHRNSVIIRKRQRTEVNGGYWEFPMFEGSRKKSAQTQLRRFLGFSVPKLKVWHTIHHTISSNRITLQAYQVDIANRDTLRDQFSNCTWHEIITLNQYPFTGSHRKLRAILCSKET